MGKTRQILEKLATRILFQLKKNKTHIFLYFTRIEKNR